MNVSFETEPLRECCLLAERAEKLFGGPTAQILMDLLANIDAFENAHEFIDFFGNAAIINGNVLDLPIGATFRATFVPVGMKLAQIENGKVDWLNVRRLKLMDIAACP